MQKAKPKKLSSVKLKLTLAATLLATTSLCAPAPAQNILDWNVAGDHDWDGLNWIITGGVSMNFADGDTVNFTGEEGGNSATITITSGVVTVNYMYVSGDKDYSIAGAGFSVINTGYLALGQRHDGTSAGLLNFNGTLDLTGTTSNSFEGGIEMYTGALRVSSVQQMAPPWQLHMKGDTTVNYSALATAIKNTASNTVAVNAVKTAVDDGRAQAAALPTLIVAGGVTLEFDGSAGTYGQSYIDPDMAGSWHLEAGAEARFIDGQTTAFSINMDNGLLALTADDDARYTFSGIAGSSMRGVVEMTGENALAYIEKADFTNNKTTAFYVQGASDTPYPGLVLNDVNFTGNIGFSGGLAQAAAMHIAYANVYINKAKFDQNNHGDGKAGALSIDNAFVYLYDASFTDNFSEQGVGGAIYLKDGWLELNAVNQDVVFNGNIADTGVTAYANSIFTDATNGGTSMLKINVADGKTLDMQDPLRGKIDNASNFAIVKSGTGVWKLGGNNLFEATVPVNAKTTMEIDAGTLHLYGSQGSIIAGAITLLGDDSSFSLASGATLETGGVNTIISGGIILAHNSTLKAGAADSSLLLNAGGYPTIAINHNVNVTADAGQTLTMYSGFSGPGGLTKTGAGLVLLNAVSSYSGVTHVNAGTLQAWAAGALSNASVFNVAAGATLDTGTFSGQIIAGLDNTDGLNGTVNINQDLTVNTTNLADNHYFYGKLSGAGRFVKAGPGVQTLAVSTESDFSGIIEVNGGTLVLSGDGYTNAGPITINSGGTLKGGSANAFSAAAIYTIYSGGTLDLGGYAQTVAALGNGGTIELGAQTLTIGNGSSGISNSTGSITGTGGLTVAAQHTLNISAGASNSYSGVTEIKSGGSIAAEAANSLSSASLFQVDGLLRVISNQTIGGLRGTGQVQLDSDLTVSQSQSTDDHLFSGQLSGAGNFTKDGPGALTLSGYINSSFSGQLQVNGGKLALSASYNTYTGETIINNGATLSALSSYALSADSQHTVNSGGMLDITGMQTLTKLNVLGGGEIVLNGNALLILSSAVTNNISGIISGTGGLTVNGQGVKFNGPASTYTGDTTISAGGGISADSVNALSANSRFVVDGNLSLLFSQTIGGLSSTGITGNIEFSTATTILVIDQNQDDTYAGKFTSVAPDGHMALMKTGSATLTLAGTAVNPAMQYTINGGTLKLAPEAGNFNQTGSFTGDGTLAVELGTAANQLTLTNTQGNAFSGTLEMQRGTLGLDANTDSLLSNSTLKLSGANSSAALAANRTLNGLSFNGGTLIFSDGSNITPSYMLTVNNLDIGGTGGSVRVPVTGVIRMDTVLNSLFDYAAAANQVQLVGVTGNITGTGNQLAVQDANGNPLTDSTVRDLYDGNVHIGRASFGITAQVVASGSQKGLYLGYGLTQLEALANQMIKLDSDDAATAGAIMNAKLTGAGSFSFLGGKDIEVGNAASDYTGSTYADTAKVTLLSNNAFGKTSNLVLTSNAVIDMNGKLQEVNSLSGATGTGIILGALNITGGGAFAGVLSGNNGILGLQGGMLDLYGANTFTGATVVDGGELSAKAANTLSANSSLTINGGKVNLNNFNQTISTLQGNAGTELNLGTATLTVNQDADGLYNGALKGSGTANLVKDTAGTNLTLTDISGYTGGFDIKNGTLTIRQNSDLLLNNNVEGNFGLGELAIALGVSENELKFGYALLGFNGILSLLEGKVVLDGNAKAFLKDAITQLMSGGTLQINNDAQIAELVFDGGKLDIVDGTLKVDKLTIKGAGGKLSIAIPDSIDTSDPGAMNFYDYATATGMYQQVIVESSNPVTGDPVQLQWVNPDGSAFTGNDKTHEIIDNGEQSGKIGLDYVVSTNLQGIKLGYGLKYIEVYRDKTVRLDSTSSTSNILNAQLTGQGGFLFAGGKVVYVGNANSDYTGGTTLASGVTLKAIANNVFGNTKKLILGNNAYFDLADFGQTLKDLQGEATSLINIGSNGILRINGDTVGQVIKYDGAFSGEGTLEIVDSIAEFSGDSDNFIGAFTASTSEITLKANVGSAGTVIATDNSKLTIGVDGGLSGTELNGNGSEININGTADIDKVQPSNSRFNIGTTGRLNSLEFLSSNTIVVVNGNITGKSVFIDGSYLGGAGELTGDVELDDSSLGAGNSIDTLTITGNLTLTNGSVLEVEVDPADAAKADLVAVSGTAALAGSTVKHIGLPEDFGKYSLNGMQWRILNAGGGIVSEFDDVKSDFWFLDVSLVYDTNMHWVDLAIKRNQVDFADLAETPNQYNTGKGLESLDVGNSDLIYDLVQIDQSTSIPWLLDQLSGEIHATAAGSLQNYDRTFGKALRDRIMVKNFLDNGYPLWVTFDAHATNSESTWNTGKAKFEGAGITLGTEANLTDDIVLGGAFRYGKNSIDMDSRNSDADIKSYSISLYGGWDVAVSAMGKLRFALGGAYGYHEVETTRDINVVPLNQHLKGDYDARSLQFFGEVAYSFNLTESVNVGPYAGVAWNSIHTESFTEKGGNAVLHSKSQTNDNISSTLGVRAEYSPSETFTLRGDINWQHIYGDKNPEARLNFVGGSSFTIEGAPYARDAVGLNVGAEMQVTESMRLTGGYEGLLGSDYQSHGGKLSFIFSF